MKIATSQVALSNDYQSKSASARKVTLAKGNADDDSKISRTTVDISSAQLNQLKQLAQDGPQQGIESKDDKSTDEFDTSGFYEKGLYVMKMLLEQMTGKAIDLFNASDFMKGPKGVEGEMPTEGEGATSAQGESPNDMVQVDQYHYESQSNHLQFSGSIEQQNGRKTQFQFSLSFAQEYESVSSTVMKREQLKDPLVISFTTKPVTLSNKRFDFDIDADKQKDSLAMLESGHGFLALDRNGDSKINDGSELFGALSGDGFSELAQYDEDQNGFIDENDSIFKELSVWIKNEGEDRQISLKAAGIGAIALENIDTPLTIRDGDEKLGLIRKSGFYLNEDGKAGLIQQLDFVV
jgi:hypothetical protein